jgi:hypothetical protein
MGGGGLGIFLFTTASRTALGPTQPPIQWVPGAFFPWGQSGRGVKLTTHVHLVPRSKNAWSYTSTPQYAFRAWCLVKHRDNFTFTSYAHAGAHARTHAHEGVSKSFRTGRLERELQMVQFSATRCSCIDILWVSLVSFAAVTLCNASQQVFIVIYFVIDSVRKLLDTPSYIGKNLLLLLKWLYSPMRTLASLMDIIT